MFNRWRWLALLLVGMLVFTASAGAQTTSSATITPPETDAFPTIVTFLDVSDAQGQFLHGLQPADVLVLEDNQPVDQVQLQELRSGAQTVIVFNPGPAFAIRDSQGLSRLDLITEALKDWAMSRQGSTLDDLSFLATGGPESTHLPTPADWLAVLESYQPDSRQVAPNLDTLLRAVELASDPLPRPGMERAVLFVTAPMEGDLTFGLQNLTARAREQNVRIFIWLVASADVLSSPSTTLLSDLAVQTGGQFFFFSGTEAVPSLETYLEPLRDRYQLSYVSRIKTAGAHQLVVEVRHAEGSIQTAPLNFNFDIQAPDPAFLSPELEIYRNAPEAGSNNLLRQIDPGELYPAEHELEVLIDFPDGHTRPLVKTTLFVDGEPVAENYQPPFDRFIWDLRPYTEPGQHLLRVEATDSLGLTGSSIDTLFQVRVERPGGASLAVLAGRGPLIGGVAVLLSGAVLFLVLILSGRIHPYAFKVPRRLRRRKSKSDPVTQPVPVKTERFLSDATARYLPGWVNRLHWPQRRIALKATAFLTRISEAEPSADTVVPIPLTGSELTFGNDPEQATLVLEDPSVESLHARLTLREDGCFRLADEGSTAGTWINYTPVSREGAMVEHGDLIHIGRVGFRFIQRETQRQRKPVITLKEPPA